MAFDSSRRSETWSIRRAQLEVILAALAFAASVPANKLLLADVAPLALSGVLYISAGSLCAGLAWLAARTSRTAAGGTNAIRGAEWGWLLGAVVAGGVLAPLLLFLGLRLVSGHMAGLLLNFEAVFTVGLGVLLSGEYLGRRGWSGALTILAGAVLLSLPHAEPASIPDRWTGIALVIGACALWGLDNNFTQRVSLRDARQIVAIKGLVGGVTSLSIAAAFGGFGHWTVLRALVALTVGAVCFGLSIVLFVRGLRHLGVIQTGMLFALAPGFAALLSLVFLRETLAAWSLVALASMTVGALLLATDRHQHLHEHEALEHAHEHIDDEHHLHEHTPAQLAQAPHAHWHRHEPMVHRHPHVHDIHHRHRH
jgi:drug/metabolite transporter (DMT)-like permease